MNPNIIEIIGFTASLLSTLCLLPQVYRIWRSRPAPAVSVSALMYLTLCVGAMLWFIYGLGIHSRPVQLNNIIVFLLSFSIFVYKIRYK